jgi:hypothetical protein
MRFRSILSLFTLLAAFVFSFTFFTQPTPAAGSEVQVSTAITSIADIQATTINWESQHVDLQLVPAFSECTCLQGTLVTSHNKSSHTYNRASTITNRDIIRTYTRLPNVVYHYRKYRQYRS